MTTELGDAFGTVARVVRASTVAVHDARGRGSGSGVVWNARGLVITNAHVVRGPYATVEVDGGARLRATLVGRDADIDLAVLRVDFSAAQLRPAVPRDSATLVPAELVLAAGHPHGIAGAVATGLVHRCNARWVIHDVRLAPGNSGGPLADANGRVVGINSMIARGLGLAVPSSTVAAFLAAIGEDARAA